MMAKLGDNHSFKVAIASNKTIVLTPEGDDLMTFPEDEYQTLGVQLLSWTILFIVVSSNTFVIKRMLKESKTFLDWLVVADCCLCYGALVSWTLRMFNIRSCTLTLVWVHWMTATNRMITLAIVTYRYVYVVMWRWVQSPRQQKSLNTLLTFLVLMLPMYLSSATLYYRENFLRFLGKNSKNKT